MTWPKILAVSFVLVACTEQLVEAITGAIDLFDPTDDGTRHVSHFATCPCADQHRRAR